MPDETLNILFGLPYLPFTMNNNETRESGERVKQKSHMEIAILRYIPLPLKDQQKFSQYKQKFSQYIE